jgi:type 1 glutamine amidotransferase
LVSICAHVYSRTRKISYLTGKKKEPTREDPVYATWDAKNSMFMTWLMNAMDEGISSNYMCCSTAKKLYGNVKLMYSNMGNES